MYQRCLWLLMLLPLTAAFAYAQQGNNNQQNAGGIQIDAQGVVQTMVARRESPAAAKKRQQEYLKAKLTPEIVVSTERRVLSLRELETQVQAALDQPGEIPVALQALCGINRLDEIILDIEQNDVLIAGPAEGFAPDTQGRLRGVESGRPTLLLDDLVIAIRAAYTRDSSLGCSIDPTTENLARLQDYLRQNSTVTSTAGAAQRYRVMAQILGPQEVTVWGAPRDTHFSLVLVEADLRMKRISLGVDLAGVKGIKSQLALLRPQGNSMQRWWFVPNYDPIQTNGTRSQFLISGPRIKLLAQEEYSDASGQRFDAAQTRNSTQEFARLFTEHYAELAEKQPVFAELQNVFDLAVLGALIRKEGLNTKADWTMSTLLNEQRLPVGHYPEPRFVPSQSTNRMAGNLMLGLVGGVTLDPQPVLRYEVRENLTPLPALSREGQKLTWNVAE